MSNNSEYPLGYSSSIVGVLQKRSASKAADFIMSNITNLPFEDHSFDVVYTNAVMWTLARSCS